MGIPETANKGLEGIVACTSEISTIHDATLLYRGFAIEDLAGHQFEEIIYLLWKGDLPEKGELEKFQAELCSHLILPKEMKSFLENLAGLKAHSMAKLRTAVSYFSLFDEKSDPSGGTAFRDATRLTAAIGTIVANLSRLESGLSYADPDPKKSISWNFLNLITGKEPDSEDVSRFDTALVLHADHELNASTFTARVVASTLSDYYSDIVGAICSLKGPLHGGANEQVMKMLEDIGSLSKVDSYVKDAIESKKKVMGIGHRVYKNGDPRAKILKKMAEELSKKNGMEEQFQMLNRIHETMESKKGLMPNVDFYSGLVYTALGLRPRDFTPVFAISRIAGWSAQVFEQYGNNRIYRPRAHYTGPTGKKVQKTR